MASTLKDSKFLVTGAFGYVGSHVVDQILKAGYSVRGTARSADTAHFLTKKFKLAYGEDRFELAVIPDQGKDGAFDEAMAGCSGVAHVAFVGALGSGCTDCSAVIPPVIDATLSVLRSAARTPTIKRFVMTSSINAAAMSALNVERDVGEDGWNERAEKLAWKAPKTMPGLEWIIYAAAKVAAEKTAWKYMEESKPGFVFNAVLPGIVFGPTIDGDIPSTASWPIAILNGRASTVSHLSMVAFVDARDVGKLHLSALVSPSFVGKRAYAVSDSCSWESMAQVLRRLRPEADIPNGLSTGKDLTKYDTKRGKDLLKEMDQDGFISLEQSLEDLLKSLGI